MCAVSSSGDDLHGMRVAPGRLSEAVASVLGPAAASSTTEPRPADGTSDAALFRHRILQANGRRYSINVEENYWDILGRLARRHGIRLSQFIHQIASADGAAPLAATLRLVCLRAMVAEVQTLERRIEEHKRTSGPNYVQSLVDANPSPALLVAQTGVIQRSNAAFARWSRTPAEKLVGQSYEWFFQLRASIRISEIQARFAAGSREIVPARISYIAPGRVVVAKANLCLASSQGVGEYVWAVQIDDAAPRS
jgi:predicted DNA-binding ribbon-helix-helix protein